MGSGKGHDHHDGFVGSPLLGLSEEGQGVVGDQIREIIPGVVPSVSHFVPIDVDRVVVEARISHQTEPLVPTHGNVVTIVLVEVLAKVA